LGKAYTYLRLGCGVEYASCGALANVLPPTICTWAAIESHSSQIETAVPIF